MPPAPHPHQRCPPTWGRKHRGCLAGQGALHPEANTSPLKTMAQAHRHAARLQGEGAHPGPSPPWPTPLLHPGVPRQQRIPWKSRRERSQGRAWAPRTQRRAREYPQGPCAAEACQGAVFSGPRCPPGPSCRTTSARARPGPLCAQQPLTAANVPPRPPPQQTRGRATHERHVELGRTPVAPLDTQRLWSSLCPHPTHSGDP